MADQATTTPDKLSPALDGKYKLVHTTPGVVITSKNEYVDLRTITLERADQLVEAGQMPFLERINPPAKGSKAATE